MHYLWNDLNLIDCLTFYFLMMFAIGLLRRWQQYRELISLLFASATRWPKLLNVVKGHRTIFLTWRTVFPLALTLGLMFLQMIAKYFLQTDQDGLSLHKLWQAPLLGGLVTVLGVGMVGLDVCFLLFVVNIDRPKLEKYFDQAEYWLNSHWHHVVKIVTFGWLNPRRTVAVEVQKALVDASNLLNWALWGTTLQMGLRFSFGLCLWIAWWLLK